MLFVTPCIDRLPVTEAEEAVAASTDVEFERQIRESFSVKPIRASKFLVQNLTGCCYEATGTFTLRRLFIGAAASSISVPDGFTNSP